MKEDKTERLFPAVILNLSGIYKEEKFWLQGNGNSERCEQISEISWVDAQDISGTNCYCDEEAAAEINRRTENVPVAGSILLIPAIITILPGCGSAGSESLSAYWYLIIIQICSCLHSEVFCPVEDGSQQLWKNWKNFAR